MNSHSQRVVVIGGGITGLAAALRVADRAPQVELRLLEASTHVGGVIETVRQDGFLVERSADNFITNVPWAIDFCRRLGLEPQLAPTNDTHRRAFVVCRGKLEPIPPGFLVMAPSRLGPLLKSPILSWRAKLRLACEYFVPPSDAEDESLAGFATRRLGRETYERLVQPLVGGIYTADPDKLSIRAAMPRFFEMERAHGSLIRAMRSEAKQRGAGGRVKLADAETSGGKAIAESSKGKSESAARYSMFTTPRGGLSTMVDAAVEQLPSGSVRCHCVVQQIRRGNEGGWVVQVLQTDSGAIERIEADAVVLAAPACRAADVLDEVDPNLAGELRQIECASCAVVSLGYRREQIGHSLDGFGFVVPQIERRRILSASFSSVKYAGRAPRGCELIRVFLGGACQPELADLPDDELRAVAVEELADLLSIRGEPIFHLISRWPRTMPQYHLGHNALVESINRRVAELPALALAGNAFDGVGIPHCIHSGQQAAERVLGELSRTTASEESAPKPQRV